MNFDEMIDRRASGCEKWNHYAEDVLPMWVADMDFTAPPPILESLQKYAQYGDLGYRLPSTKLYETIAARLDKLYGWKVSADMIVTVPGVIQRRWPTAPRVRGPAQRSIPSTW